MGQNRSIIAFSCGDVNGIGLEVFIKTFSNDLLFKHVIPVLYCHESVLKETSDSLSIQLPNYQVLRKSEKPKEGLINVIELEDANVPELNLGTPSLPSGAYALASLKWAVDGIVNGVVQNLVTLPIDKKTIQSEEFEFPGHTEYLADAFQADSHMMLLISESMRVGVVTGHIPIQNVAKSINAELLTSKIEMFLHALRQDFGVVKPKLAVLGLNPHSGDDGLLGSEEKDVIAPVINSFREKGDIVVGPYSADGFFGNRMYEDFDGVLAMYHDQGLIPFKQLSFSKGTNFTAGLPIIRTSPDHGTAYDIAGKGEADPGSLIEAIFTLQRLYRTRLEHFDLKKDPLDFIKHRREKFSIGVPNIK